MVEPWPMRIKKWVCKHLGHREKKDEWSTWCGRCSVLIAGPLNGGGTRASDNPTSPEGEHEHEWVQQIGPGMTSRHVCSICRVVSSPGATSPNGGAV